MNKSVFEITNIKQLGITKICAKSTLSFAKHSHSEYGFGYIESGAQKSYSGRGIVEANSGDIICVNPEEVHDGAPFGCETRAWKMLYLPSTTIKSIGFAIYERELDVEFEYPSLSNSGVLTRIKMLIDHSSISTKIDEFWFEQELIEICKALFVCQKQKNPNIYKADLSPAIKLIAQQYHNPLNLASLASQCNLSKFQLIRGFKAKFGITPHSYLNDYRLEIAKSGIKARHPISQIALENGFADQAHFTRAFVKKFGATPKQYANAF